MEALYDLLRPYGKIVDFSFNPSYPKITTDRHALITFRYAKNAVSARNCLHRLNMNGCTLLIEHEQYFSSNRWRKFIVDHPRVFIPIGVAAIFGISYAVFDPIRV